jgi:hypothetical protein
MQLLFGSKKPRLEAWTGRPVDPRIALGPSREFHSDVHKSQIGLEEPGLPGPLFQRLGKEIMRFNVFPPGW